ncbi:deoxyguanosinetriphosphate triphosphohydrolase-like protein [Jeongeupia sp. HS-3]|uniref:deoxyguanosinetriphosphate triphosphohydrolase n=1 Tax=Jeongeupia sp. HS-3 TaxID=1009682 RepID=UPI0018A3ABB2|nr:deoxyguanosinetriphosphate triphosphohydrolase [Jeongeupia sp. HS-3]BCL77256.1 deoxyguanosinetriphosphate triphosphohydrolase-like protein [Jeongeupia sp. HS-3]
MDWNQLLSANRLGTHESTPIEAGRSNYHKDHDRIVFCSPFRRMGRKTQVHPMTENDHVHTRLTHSIEVACVGRSLGVLVGEAIRDKLPAHVNPYDLGAIVQAACLAHDIGNPPFGHAGEYAIRDWFRRDDHAYLLQNLSPAERRDLITYEGNAQGFRIITQLENHRFEGGLRLTYATLGTTLKYPWTSDHACAKGKFSCYVSELPLLGQIAAELGLPQLAPGRWARHPLSYLMEAADDICYAILDLEDGIEIGMLAYETVEPILMKICGGERELLALEVAAAPSVRRKISLLRGKAIDRCVRDVAATFIAQYERLMDGSYQGDLLNDCPAPMRLGINEAKQLARDRIFNERRKIEIEVGSFTCLDILLDAFCNAAYQLKVSPELPFRMRRVLDLMDYNAPKKEWPLYDTYQRVLDFIGGMTDNYATYLAQQVGGMGR